MRERVARKTEEMVAAVAEESSSSADWLVGSAELDGALCVGLGIECEEEEEEEEEELDEDDGMFITLAVPELTYDSDVLLASSSVLDSMFSSLISSSSLPSCAGGLGASFSRMLKSDEEVKTLLMSSTCTNSTLHPSLWFCQCKTNTHTRHPPWLYVVRKLANLGGTISSLDIVCNTKVVTVDSRIVILEVNTERLRVVVSISTPLNGVGVLDTPVCISAFNWVLDPDAIGEDRSWESCKEDC